MEAHSVKALKYLIRNAPAGEIQDVLHHLSTLAEGQENISQQPELLSQLRKWYESHKYHIPLPNGKIGMVTTAGNRGEDAEGNFQYYDHENQCTFSFNPFT